MLGDFIQNKDEKVNERLIQALNTSDSQVLTKGPLIDSHSCEVVNQCGISAIMLEAYYRHVDYMKSSIFVKHSRSEAWEKNIGIIGDIFEVSITMLACFLYVLGTYYENDYPVAFQIIDTTVASIFLVD